VTTKEEALEKAVSMAQSIPYVFVATASAKGLPHMASAAKLTYASAGRVVLAEWFCPRTIANLAENRRVALVVWDSATDSGFQLLGEVEDVKDLSFVDGYTPDEEDKPRLPTVERELHVHVDSVLAFSHGPHSDVEE
jgi:predicted pyridoxine 5'-phosphate oxidase superfamily flavin-nucleotide-binding protein